MKRILLLALLLTGCSSLTPYASLRHQSDPQIHNDGLNTLCGGIKRPGQLSIKAGWCHGHRELYGTENMAEVEIEYDFIRR